MLLVSHDRDFMDNVVTGLLVLEGDGVVTEQAGGYSDWEARGGRLRSPENPAAGQPAKPTLPATEVAVTPAADKRKLSYKDQRELDALPGLIEELEQSQQALEQKVSDPGFYQRDQAEVQQVLADLTDVQAKLENAFERWSQLDG